MKFKYFLISFLIVLLDQLTKIYTKFINIDLKLFMLRYIENTGAAFGILKDYKFLLIFISIIVMIFVIYYMLKIKDKLSLYGLSFILGGTIGNLIDRVFLGFVRDFIDFKFWPAFNVSDSFITIGGLILVYILLFKKDLD
jgi:signal peptidase II